jgi:hypothetical protein
MSGGNAGDMSTLEFARKRVKAARESTARMPYQDVIVTLAAELDRVSLLLAAVVDIIAAHNWRGNSGDEAATIAAARAFVREVRAQAVQS